MDIRIPYLGQKLKAVDRIHEKHLMEIEEELREQIKELQSKVERLEVDPTDEKAWADYWKCQYELLANRVDEAQAVLGGFRDDD